MEEDARDFVFLLAATDHELILLDTDIEFVLAEAGHRKRDPKDLALGPAFDDPFDIVGRIAVTGRLGEPVDSLLDLLEAEEQRVGECREARHCKRSFTEATCPPDPHRGVRPA